jgi:uncharacterized protein (TIGR03435 family)
MIRAIARASWIVWLSPGLLAQTAPSVRPFEVASVKPHTGPGRVGISTSGPRLNAEPANLWALIAYAYNLKTYQIPSTPPLSALGNEYYDIVAKAEGDGAPTKDEFRGMLQLLLADRFKLAVHRETREMPVYALLVGKNGPKFKASAPDASPDTHYAASGRNWEVTIPKATMDDVLRAIESSILDRPVLDKTELKGTYDVKMTYTPNIPPNRRSEPDPEDISIFTAVEVQLGLKLEAQKAKMEVLVVDRVEKPSEN